MCVCPQCCAPPIAFRTELSRKGRLRKGREWNGREGKIKERKGRERKGKEGKETEIKKMGWAKEKNEELYAASEANETDECL